MTRQNKYRVIFAGIIMMASTIIVLSLLGMHAASAFDNSTRLGKVGNKSILDRVYSCYSSSNVKGTVNVGNEWKGIDSFLNPGGEAYSYINMDVSNGLGSTTCYNLIKDHYASMVPSAGGTPKSDVIAFLESIGYKRDESSNELYDYAQQQCYSYNINRNGSPANIKVCVPVNPDNGEITAPFSGDGTMECSNETSNNLVTKCSITGNMIKVEIAGTTYDNAPCVSFGSTSGYQSYDGDHNKGKEFYISPSDSCVRTGSGTIDTPDKFSRALIYALQHANNDRFFRNQGYSFDGTDSTKWVSKSSSTDNAVDIFKLNKDSAATDAIKKFSNNDYTNMTQLYLTYGERGELMLYYLKTYYGIRYASGTQADSCQSDVFSNSDYESRGYKLAYLGNKTYCYILPLNHSAADTVGGYTKSGGKPTGEPFTWNDVVDEINSLATHIGNDVGSESGELPTQDGANSSNISDNENTPGNSDQPMCYEAAKTLGWILCPVLEGMGLATRGLYQAFIEPFLNISSDFLQTGNSVENGWSNFRNFANTLFAIAFVIVILAQITGIGISNYNIKKILPRLIMVVVLVNLSFIICQLAVDVSNILGSGLYNLFIDLAGGVKSAGESYGLGGIITTLLGTLGIAGVGVAAFTIAKGTWELWLIPFLLALVGCIIGALFFFIVLAVRQAGIIVLIVLSPIAIVCYALPNTKSFFDRWKKMFMSLLVVYPICGILLGGGLYVSKLLTKSGGSDNVFFMLAGMLVQVVPFFMIPSIVRSSMTALGNLGNKIAGFGQRLGGRATGAISRSRFVQDRQQELTRQNTLARDRRIVANNQSIIDSLSAKEKAGTITDRERRRLRMAEYRQSRSRGRIEKSAIEEANNTFNANREMLDVNPGNQRYQAMVSRLQEQAAKQDAEDWATRLDAGDVEIGGNVVNTADLDSLSMAHEHLLTELMAHPEDAQTLAQVRAIQNKMAKQKDLGFERMHQNYLHLQAQAQGDAAKEAAVLKGGISRAAGHVMNEYAGDLKAYGGKGMMLSFQDMQGNKFSAMKAGPDGIRNLSTSTDIGKRRYYAKDFAANDPSSLKESNFNDLSDDWFNRTIEAVTSGDMDATQAQQLATVANSYLHNDNVEKKTGVVSKVNSLLDALYGSSNLPTTAGGPIAGPTRAGAHETVGSQTIMSSPSTAAATITADLKSAGQWSSMDAAQQQRYANMVSNVQYALDHGTFNQADARQLQDVLKIAHANGYGDAATTKSGVNISGLQMDATGNVKVNDLKSVTFYPNSGGPRHIDLPPTWTRRASDGVWIDTASGKKLKGEDLTRADAIEKHNIDVDIHNTN